MKKILFFVLMLCVCGCEENKVVEKPKASTVIEQETKHTPKKNDKYVYIDYYNCLHLDKNCIYLEYQEEALDEPCYAIRYYAKEKLSSFYQKYFCRRCISIEDFEELENIVKVNENKRKIYDALDRYYNMPPYEKFLDTFNNKEGRRKIYDSLEENDCTEFGDNYEEFINLITLPYKSDDKVIQIVYIRSNNAVFYHLNSHCEQLRNECRVGSEIVWVDEIALGEAERRDLTPCAFCVDKNSVRSQKIIKY